MLSVFAAMVSTQSDALRDAADVNLATVGCDRSGRLLLEELGLSPTALGILQQCWRRRLETS